MGSFTAPVSPLPCLSSRLEEVRKRVGVQAFRAMRLDSYSYFDRPTFYALTSRRVANGLVQRLVDGGMSGEVY